MGAIKPENYERFCQEYVTHYNGSKAAIAAGYAVAGARVKASQLLTKGNIQARIRELQEELAKRCGITAEMVVNELAAIGFSNVQDFIAAGNLITDISQMPEETARAVKSIKRSVTEFEGGEKTVVSFELHDKVSALEKLARHLGIFDADNSQKRPIINVSVE